MKRRGQTLRRGRRANQKPSVFKEKDGKPIIGFCLWCNRDFYTMEEYEEHTANNLAACAVFQELKDKDCTPPVLQALFEGSGSTYLGGKE
jgi:hypothetical protein